MSTPIYKVIDGSTITFSTRGPLRSAILTKPDGEVIKGREWMSSAIDYPGIAEEMLLANNIVDYNAGGTPLPYTIEGEQDQSDPNSKGNNYIYEIPRKSMNEVTDETALSVAKVNNEVSSQNNKVLKSTLESELPPDVRLTNFINSQKSTVKRLLIPFVIGLITPFAPQIIPVIISNLGISGDSTVDSIKSSAGDKKAAAQGALSSAKETAQDPAAQKAAALFVLGQIPKEQLIEMIKCPSSAKIQSIVKQRNQLVTQINGIYKSITTLSTVFEITTTINQALLLAIVAVLNLPAPVPINVIFKMADIRNFINANSGKISGLVISTAQYGVFLGIILKFLDMLDIILQLCAEDQKINFEKINDEINALANPTVKATQDDNTNTYKGFTLGVKIDETNNSKYIRRYAVAQNKQGIDVLRTESSFASDPAVLVSQLKFIIDTNPNITAE
jgi:hypothetical protein